tara:strand:+ start:444 stop:926 length:483 start_codon:yes stop_codon:yes gene_type:complete
LTTSSLPYISPHGTTGWLVRVPCAYFHDLNSKRLQYKQKLFTFLKHGSSDQALEKAVEFRDLHQIKGLEYNHRGPSAGNGRQVRVKRIRGNDLPFGITHTLRYSRQGKEQHFITVQACCGYIRRSKSFMYGHSRTREEAITKAKSTLAVFLSEIEESLDE